MSVDLPNPYGHSRLRRNASFRRTTSVDVIWPEGRYGKLQLIGVGRDIFTHNTTQPIEVLAFNGLRVTVTADKYIEAIACEPDVGAISSLRGLPCVGGFRRGYQSLVGQGVPTQSPLVLLLDDVIGATVVSDWAWSVYPNLISAAEKQERKGRLEGMAGVCAGFRAGSSALAADGDFQYTRCAIVPSLPHPSDPDGWHPVKNHADVSLRRSRCMDVWLENHNIIIESIFQDSAVRPDGRRVAVHEYSLRAEVSLEGYVLQGLTITPHILPYPECPSALSFAYGMIGKSLPEFNTSVLTMLRREKGCTHLNDALRALSDLPEIFSNLPFQV
ncbi:DUF2889 domain-containing protein [Halioxenophilus aromaticivorans]|uniref:DUF2889 domain-containing protein n=1 Tax=Halioxenophilus aromaticivorans TaxID=1306992 RepID=UPI0031E6BC4E